MRISAIPFLQQQAIHRPYKRPADAVPVVQKQARRKEAPIRTAEALNQRIFSETVQFIREQPLPRFEISTSTPLSTLPLQLQREILVIDASTFQATLGLVQQGFRPLVLDMANATRAGGNVLEGSNAQEETLCRQSNLYPALQIALNAGLYPIPERGGLLAKNISFFRNDYYAFLKEPFQADVFVLAAYNCNPDHKIDAKRHLRGYDKPKSEEDYAEGTKAKMRALCRTAKLNGNDSLVLGAFGCGAFRNDPIQIAKWIREVLNEPEFHSSFKMVVFGIPKSKNLLAFQDVFPSNI